MWSMLGARCAPIAVCRWERLHGPGMVAWSTRVGLALLPVGSRATFPACGHDEGEVVDIEETDEAVELVERVWALDLGKAALTVGS